MHVELECLVINGAIRPYRGFISLKLDKWRAKGVTDVSNCVSCFDNWLFLVTNMNILVIISNVINVICHYYHLGRSKLLF